jgi:hypothetical protein
VMENVRKNARRPDDLRGSLRVSVVLPRRAVVVIVRGGGEASEVVGQRIEPVHAKPRSADDQRGTTSPRTASRLHPRWLPAAARLAARPPLPKRDAALG